MKRMFFVFISLLLLATEILIGLFASGWVRGELGDVLVVPLIYTVCRAVSPCKPGYGWIMPSCVLAFAFLVESAQLINIADLLGVTDPILRIVIGTSFSPVDLLCYTVGTVPLYLFEAAVRKREK